MTSSIAAVSALPLPPLSEHQLLVLLCQVALMLSAARVAGHVARRLGQPRVIGELGAGILLGPSVLGAIRPGAQEWLFPADGAQAGLLLGLAWLGALFLVALAGAETDVDGLRRSGRVATATTLGSLLVPLAAGFGIGAALPDSFLGENTDRLTFALFIAVALSISSLPVAAKILVDLGHLRSRFGQLTLGVAMANDVVGWLLLGVVSGMAAGGGVELGPMVLALLGLAVLVPVVVGIGPLAVDTVLSASHRRAGGPAAAASIAAIAIVGCGAVTQWLGVEAVIGAFLAGIAIGRSRLRQVAALHHLEVVTSGVLAPIFFATAGVRVDLGSLWTAEALPWAVAVVLVATAAKLLGAAGGARLAGLPARESLALGAALNARGALEIVVATVGLAIGILTTTSYSVVVLMALATSVLASPLVHAAMGRGRPDGEADEEDPVTGRGVSVLVAPDPEQSDDLGVVAALWPDERQRHAPARLLQLAGQSGPAVDRTFAPAVCEEAAAGHGAIFLTEAARPGRGFGAPVETVLRGTSLPIVLLRSGSPEEGRPRPPGSEGILVPIDGRAGSVAAARVAATLAERWESPLTLLHVVRADVHDQGAWLRGCTIVDHCAQELRARGLTVETAVVRARRAGSPIVGQARGFALTVLGLERRNDGGAGGATCRHVLLHGGRPQLVVVAAAT